ncbi:SPFH domain-containing protein [Geomesophilobacter sediminis]|nr:SPFH domain-containing protein [Geomesophilobacter sediminis]
MEFLAAHYTTIVPLVVLAIIVGILLYNSIVNVPGTDMAILERRWFGRKMPQGRVVAMEDEVGIQARTLGPGLHFLIPFLYTAQKHPFVEIKDGEVGMVESIDGIPIPPGRIFAQVVEGHNAFQDGELFLKNGGQKGPQIQILPPGKYRINPFQFQVTTASAVFIDKGRVGVVTAMDGDNIPAGRLLGQSVKGHSNFENGQGFLEKGGQKGPQIDILQPGTYRINTNLFRVEIHEATVVPASKIGLVTALDGAALPESEYIAKAVAGHDDYQDAQKFLVAGGQRGPQLDVLRPGTYYVNPLMFKVEPDDVAVVERGQVAVVISNVGEEPTEEMKRRLTASQTGEVADADEARERYVVPKGYRGIQEEVAGPGRYYLNKRAFIPYIIDTTNITIDWDNSAETRFDPLKVISKDGFPIDVSVKVVVRVRPDQAPYMVAKVGSIENLILHVIHPMIDSSFRNQASSTSAMNFLQNRQEEQTRAEDRARLSLEKYHVECVSVLICQINLPQELMETQTKRIIAEQQKEMFAMQQEAEAARISTEKTRATADQQGELVKAEIGVKVADQQKQRTIVLAQGDAEGVRLRGEGEAKKIEAIGQATAEAYRKQNAALGQQAITAIEVIKKIAEGNIRVTPDILVSGEKGGLLDVLIAQMVKKGTPTMTVAEPPAKVVTEQAVS